MEFFKQTNPLAPKLLIGSVEPVSYAVVVGFEILRLIVSPARGGSRTYKISLQINKKSIDIEPVFLVL